MMGRHKIGDEPRNWPLSVKVKKSVGKYLDSLVSRLGWSKASFLTELILKFGEAFVNQIQKESNSTDYGEEEDPSGALPSVTSKDKEM